MNYLRTQVQKVSRSTMRRTYHQYKAVDFYGNKPLVKKPISEYAQFTSAAFSHIRDRKYKIGNRPTIIVAQMWSEAQRKGIKPENFQIFIQNYARKFIKSVHQGEEDRMI